MSTSIIAERLTRLSRLIQADERSVLPPVQLQALQYLARSNRYSDTPAAVADYLETTRGTASQSINVLESAGLISKHANATDRRVVRLRLTARGRRVVDGSTAASPIMTAIDGLGEAERDGLELGLRRLLEAIGSETGRRSFGVCRTCRHFQRLPEDRYRCGLMEDPLSPTDSELICREHSGDDPDESLGP